MRTLFCVFLITSFLFSCKNANNDKKADGSDSAGVADKGSRSLPEAVNDLKTILESGNKNSIADLIDFPVADSIIPLYLDDSSFQKSYNAQGDRLTRPLFINYYDAIAKYTYLQEIINVFKHVPMDSLKYTNEIERAVVIEDDPCLNQYSITLEENTVRLRYGTGRNPDYVKKGAKEDEESEDGGCEYAVFWTFRFDGNKFHLVQYAAAG